MANTAVKQSASPNHITYLFTSDGTGAAAPSIASATLLADMVNGPLRDAWRAAYANQAAMRTALLGGGADCTCKIELNVDVAGTTGEKNQVTVDVDVDGTTATRAQLVGGMSQTGTGQLAYVTLVHKHSFVK